MTRTLIRVPLALPAASLRSPTGPSDPRVRATLLPPSPPPAPPQQTPRPVWPSSPRSFPPRPHGSERPPGPSDPPPSFAAVPSRLA
ncbi:hypothetical protein KUCAC02_033089 [Chaenocephalus aceratus]|nr:hypothetical protein KUCAC02_033089 [Chaenocephalus aceratus]